MQMYITRAYISIFGKFKRVAQFVLLGARTNRREKMAQEKKGIESILKEMECDAITTANNVDLSLEKLESTSRNIDEISEKLHNHINRIKGSRKPFLNKL